MKDSSLTTGMAGRPLFGSSAVAGFGVLGVLLCALWAANFLLFHTLAELFSVLVGMAAAVVAWYSRDWVGRNYLLLLGLGQLCVGGIDILHTVSYRGVGVVDARGGNLPTQLWLAGRVFEAACFLVAVWAPARRYSERWLPMVLVLATGAAIGTILAGWWPEVFVPGQGVTPVKTAVEIAVVVAFGAVLVRLRRCRADFDPSIYQLLVLSVGAKMLTELCFSWYTDVLGLTHLIGHALKILGAWAFLKAVVDSGLRRPQSLIFGALERERLLSGEVARHARTLDAVLNATQDPVLMFDRSGRIRFTSLAAQLFLDRGAQELVGRNWREAGLPDVLMVPLDAQVHEVQQGEAARTRELRLTWRGDGLCLEVQASPVGGGDEAAVVVVLRDVTARTGMEEDLKASIEEKRLLIQEVHHRVKNNLHIVSSILQMQGWRITEPHLRRHFEEACGRILSLAKVHELIYRQDNVASVDFAAYARALCAELFRPASLREGRVEVSVTGPALVLPVDKAEPLALVVHELVNEAGRNAFGEAGGRVRVKLALPRPGEGAIVVADDGNPDRQLDFEGNSVALGLRMVGVLVRQMHGSISVRHGDGTEVEVRFPLAGDNVLRLHS